MRGVVGVGNLCCIEQGYLKNRGSTPPQVISFAKNILHWHGNFMIGKFNSKSWERIPNFYTYLVSSLSLKTNKCIFVKWKRMKKENI
jgi:hypothetical protein